MNPILPSLSVAGAALLLCIMVCLGEAMPHHDRRNQQDTIAQSDARTRLKVVLLKMCTPETCPEEKPDAAPAVDAS